MIGSPTGLIRLLVVLVPLAFGKQQPAPRPHPNAHLLIGYKLTVPDDLPEKCTDSGKDGGTYETSALAVYESHHKTGWGKCLAWWQANNFTVPCEEFSPRVRERLSVYKVINRAYRDGFLAARAYLLNNGQKQAIPIGYQFKLADDLPETCVVNEQGEKRDADARDVYRRFHEAGWTACIHDWQTGGYNRIPDADRAPSFEEVVSGDRVINRAYGDGFRAARLYLLKRADVNPSKVLR